MKNKVSFDSTLTKFGIGLFETIKVKEEPIELDLHMDRMFNSIKELNLNFKYEKEFLKTEVLTYIKENQIFDKALRLTVFDDGYNIYIRDIPYNEKVYKTGFKLNISPIKRGNSIIHKHKTTNYFESIYTKNYAIENGYDDGLFIDLNNTILECSMSNIFFIKDKKIFTPNSKLSILNGTTKRRIIEICGELDIEVEEAEIKLKQIEEFDFAFVSNSLMGMMKITQIEEIKYNEYNELFNKISSFL
ncbi:aminotransferase class IV [Romboutsia sp.]|uniref:aminotransferase class IV n=1 Tax=Romboutsia sp. TaxID=1965302 RepID=UPI002BD5F97B|nr:aminotransferase class IV [Romboutsia sp.]HSQ89065.1 aminotransferase class IV [Romboutsia sp.]